MKHKKLLLVRDFFLAALATFILASISHSQFVLYELSKLGVVIDFAVRTRASFEDVLGLLPAFLPVIAVGLLCGFSLVFLIKKFFKMDSVFLYPLAGGASLLAIHWLMYPILEITLVAGARSITGILMQVLAGVVGGWLFYFIRKNSLVESLAGR
ncbi:MAG: hypothetical protein KUG78_17360 [Kangiellaceae bacterium]|nr:hypothetical protein [Kangiellaceae bacterium]